MHNRTSRQSPEDQAFIHAVQAEIAALVARSRKALVEDEPEEIVWPEPDTTE